MAEQGSGASRSILVGYDGSEGAKDAAALCRTLITAAAERVMLVDVLPKPGARSGAYRRLAPEEVELPEDFFAAAIADLTGVEVEIRVYLGDSPARVLDDLADQEGLDLLVIGSPGRDLLGNTPRGSVARALLHGASVPVAVAPPGYAGRAAGSLATVAVAYDGTEEAQAALRSAAALAADAGARIEVLTVEHARNPVVSALTRQLDLPEDPQDILDQARHELDPALEAGARVLHGEASVALEEACESGVELLCVGSRGYGTAARVLLGSVAGRLLHEGRVPLLIVPRP